MCSPCYTCSSQTWQGSCLLSDVSYFHFHVSVQFLSCIPLTVTSPDGLYLMHHSCPTLCSSFPSMSLPRWPWIMFSFVSKTLYLHIQPAIPLLYCYNFPTLSLENFGHFLGVQFSYTVSGQFVTRLVLTCVSKRKGKNLCSTNDVRKAGTFIFLSVRLFQGSDLYPFWQGCSYWC